ncbi:MAG: flagellar basal body rod C-terminal domain-containing protein [Sphingobium sp.]
MRANATALSGLQASMARLNASAVNIANAQSRGALTSQQTQTQPTSAPSASPQAYKPVRVEQSSLPDGGVFVVIGQRSPATIPTYEPASPYADMAGMVARPNVDLTDELVEQISAKLSYGANLSVIRTVNQMESRIFERWA